MRNLSMKKFGTPIGAGPGRPCEKVGLAAVGTPSPWRIAVASGWSSALAFSASLVSPVALRLTVPVVFWPCWPPAETVGPPSVAVGTEPSVGAGVAELGAGGAAGAVLVSAGGAPGSDAGGAGGAAGAVLVPVSVGVVAGAVLVSVLVVLVLVLVSVGVVVVVDVVVAVVLGSAGVETPGSEPSPAGASAGVSTWTVTVWPPSSVTVIVRSCADAGKTAAPNPAVNAPADISPISSLRRLMKWCLLLPQPGQARPRRVRGVTLPGGIDRGLRKLHACF
jgi:hypothetical protein